MLSLRLGVFGKNFASMVKMSTKQTGEVNFCNAVAYCKSMCFQVPNTVVSDSRLGPDSPLQQQNFRVPLNLVIFSNRESRESKEHSKEKGFTVRFFFFLAGQYINSS